MTQIRSGEKKTHSRTALWLFRLKKGFESLKAGLVTKMPLVGGNVVEI